MITSVVCLPFTSTIKNDEVRGNFEEVEALLSTLTPGKWTKPESLSAALTSSEVEARLEPGEIVRLRGNFVLKESFKGEVRIMTLAPPFRPKTARFIDMQNAGTGGIQRATVQATGVITWYGTEGTPGAVMSFEGETYLL